MTPQEEHELYHIVNAHFSAGGIHDFSQIVEFVNGLVENKEERTLIGECVERMDDAREHLTKTRPTEMNNWGILDTDFVKERLHKMSLRDPDFVEYVRRQDELQRAQSIMHSRKMYEQMRTFPLIMKETT